MRSALVTLALIACLHPAARAEVPPQQTIELWPGTPPDEDGSIGAEQSKKNAEGTVTGITNVTKPTVTIHRPDPSKETGVAIVVCPGGGYNNLAWDHEGDQVAKWLNSIGVTAAVLKYRVPRRANHPKDQPPPQALMDAQRALSIVRSKAGDLHLDAKKIGILGFSAGGHLGAWASTNPDKRAYEPVDAADKVDCRPDFAILIYPGGVIKRGENLAPEIRVSPDTPPTFLAHAGNDPVTAENSIHYYLALKRAKVPAELHIYATGGHGFGMRKSADPSSTWPLRCEEWMRNQGILKAVAKS